MERITEGARVSQVFLHRFLQVEWRALGVQQSRGWIHYAIHKPEPHIMLFRWVTFVSCYFVLTRLPSDTCIDPLD